MNDYARIERLIRYLDDHRIEQPNLAQLAEVADLSPFHLHRLFSDWAGITPKAFLKCLTLAHARHRLQAGASVLHAALDVGLSGPGRLHDLCVSLEAASPGEIKSGGTGWTIVAGQAETPFGPCLIGESGRGICHVSFASELEDFDPGEVLRSHWPSAEVRWDRSNATRIAAAMFTKPVGTDRTAPLKAIVNGTEFQVRVWRALLALPRGTLATYSGIAEAIGNRSAARAVGSAIAQNQLAYLIPCHRVIRETGIFGQYRWGATRKRAMSAWEMPAWESAAWETAARETGRETAASE